MKLRKTKKSAEDRLGNKSPILTVLILSLGPLASQIVEALYGVVDSMWIGHTIGDSGLSAIGSSSPLDWIPKGVGFGLAVSANSQISYLLGCGKQKYAGRIVNDLILLVAYLGLLFPAIILPCIKPYVEWLGGDTQTQNDAFEFLLPLISGSSVTLLYLLMCGVLQAEGRTALFGVLQVISLVLNMGVFDPLFLLGFKTTIWGSSVATILAELLPTLVLIYFYYTGHFDIKPSVKDFHWKLSRETLDGLKTGASEIVSNLAVVPPAIILNRMIGDAASRQGVYEPVMAAYNASGKMYQIIISTTIAFTMGYIVAASYANGAHFYKRFLVLTGWCLFYCLAIGFIIQIPILAVPKFFGKLMTNNEETLEWIEKFTYSCLLITSLGNVRFVVITMIQALQLNVIAFIFSTVTILMGIPIISFSIYYGYSKDDILWLSRSYLFFDLFSIVASIIVIFYPVRVIKKKMKLEKQESIENITMHQEQTDDLVVKREL